MLLAQRLEESAVSSKRDTPRLHLGPTEALPRDIIGHVREVVISLCSVETQVCGTRS